MRRRALLAGVSTLALGSIAGCVGNAEEPTDSPSDTPTDSPTPSPEPTPSPTPTLVNGSFEDDLVGWTIGRDLPDVPGDPGRKVADSVAVSSVQAADGRRSLELFVDGSADDGTVWVQQPVDLTGHETLSVAGYFGGDEPSFNTLAKVAAYAGPEPDGGLSERDFDTTEKTEDHTGWKRYEYPVDHDGVGVVAVGMSVVWESGVHRAFDDVRLR